ncbi:L-serine ammonia-lyase, iron-sulfur-dependent, subunit beta [Cohnella endophytica]|uniref:L-serine deaminase n=1 Tax=Cohnella endophytica TaxID=2419778 RepID=A0A494XL00_9BACL|nr:L-serine ammonia-lyase, iron-sulfur-dependent subunit beta [Cohnella endophytica]RKP51395.1 L-serine ammonia-lyase, iron-sulfur-dependent, subunit beta [Cohnella endophytica]
MRFKDVFSIMGPIMIGPSSSHTAGAVRIGRVARQALADDPRLAEIVFYGSFAETYEGHGTNLALLGGLLGFDTDDLRIRESFAIAAQAGLAYAFTKGKGAAPHPNTAVVRLTSASRQIEIVGCSIGGGNIEIVQVDGFQVKFTGAYPALLITHQDRRGLLAQITQTLSQAGSNIVSMQVERKSRMGDAMSVIETDHPLPGAVIEEVSRITNVHVVTKIDLLAEVSK